ncbi:MAG: hypothetical protein M3T56_16060 [Chloroflexota bacterium]|nr:hypothetical protein [Chloroflexota bacterium]
MPHVQDHAPRDGVPARAPAPHGSARGRPHRRTVERRNGAAPRPLPGLPRLRGGLPLGRAVWPPHRGDARWHRASERHHAARRCAALVRVAAVGAPRCGGTPSYLRADRVAWARASLPAHTTPAT